MIEIAFGESPAGGLKMAKSMKPGERLNGATAVIGGTRKQRRMANKPHIWSGVTMDGGPQDVAPLTLALDIGDISDFGIDKRHALLDRLFDDFPGVSDAIMKTNRHTLARLQEAKATPEPVRMWICPGNPSELCGFYYVCHFMDGSQTPLSVVRIPHQFHKEDCIVSYSSTGEINAELFGVFTQYEEPVSELQQHIFTNVWRALAQENAPLRAVVNGSLMSVPEDFYDFALRANMPDGEFRMAQLIGLTLTNMPGISDRWLYLRIRSMLQSGELVAVSPAAKDHPYSGVIKRNES